MTEESKAEARIREEMERLGVSVAVEWRPNSGGTGDRWRDEAFRYHLTVTRNGRKVLEHPFWCGLGHAEVRRAGKWRKPPANPRTSLERAEWAAVRESARRGKPVGVGFGWADVARGVPPTPAEGLAALIRDTLYDGQAFKDWAADLGMSDDSIKVREMYHDCADITSALVGALGRDAVEALREMAHDL